MGMPLSLELASEFQGILKERSKEYGSMYEVCKKVSQLFKLITSEHISTHSVAVLMFCLKISRLGQDIESCIPFKHDTLIDMANYALLMGEVREEVLKAKS